MLKSLQNSNTGLSLHEISTQDFDTKMNADISNMTDQNDSFSQPCTSDNPRLETDFEDCGASLDDPTTTDFLYGSKKIRTTPRKSQGINQNRNQSWNSNKV